MLPLLAAPSDSDKVLLLMAWPPRLSTAYAFWRPLKRFITDQQFVVRFHFMSNNRRESFQLSMRCVSTR